MDIPRKEDNEQSPLYRYKGKILLSRNIDILAESDEAFEGAVADLLDAEGLDPNKYEISGIEARKSDEQWQ